MSKFIKATVRSNSVDDTYNRVKLKATNIWNETALIPSIGGIPLKTGDIVYVDVSEGYENPMIIGRSMDERNTFTQEIPQGGSLLFESSNGTDWTIAFVKNNILNIVNSNNTRFEIEKDTIKVNGGENGGMIKIESLLQSINNLENKTNSIINALTLLTLPVSGATAGPPAVPPVSGNLAVTQRNNIENTKLKH